jgi:hypothetical protein
MKTLELNQMEGLEGGANGEGTAFACALSVIAGAAAIYGTGGLAAAFVCNFAAAACGGLVGHGSSTGSWF